MAQGCPFKEGQIRINFLLSLLLCVFSFARSAAKEPSPGSEAHPIGWREAGSGPGRLPLLSLHAGRIQRQCKDKER